MNEDKNRAADRYEALAHRRDSFLQRARDASTYTIPSLIPPDGHSASDAFPTPYQSVGARGVNHLSGKLLTALLPTATPFFRLAIDPRILVGVDLTAEEKQAMDAALTSITSKVNTEIDRRALRVHVNEAFKHLVAGGNILMHIAEKYARVFPLAQYVVSRDPEGNVLEIVVKEKVSPTVLSDEVKEALKEKKPTDTDEMDEAGDRKTVDLYTYIERIDEDSYRVEQTVCGIVIEGSEGDYPADKLPWLALRWTRIDGEDYGRGLIEEYAGDLRSYEGLSKSIVEASVAAAKVVFLVDPTGQTNEKDLVQAENLAVITGREADVACLQVNKSADLSVALQKASSLERSLSLAFLLNTAVQRDAERVTAEEIRYMAEELENSFGGVYSVLAAEFQLPLASLLMSSLEKDGVLPDLKGKVTPTIVTGLDAIGRSQEGMKIKAFLATARDVLGPELADQYIDASEALRRIASADGLDVGGLVRSNEEVAESRKAATRSTLVQKVGPSIVNGVAKTIGNQQNGETVAPQ